MGNVKVVFATKTQHSRKIAEAIADKLGTKALNTRNKPQVSDAEVLLIVGGIYTGKSNPDILAFTEGLALGTVKKAILVTSSASITNRTQKDVREVLINKGIDVIDEVKCAGAFLFLRFGHPNTAEIQGVVDKVTYLTKAY